VEQNSNDISCRFAEISVVVICIITVGDNMKRNLSILVMSVFMGFILPCLLFSVSEKLYTDNHSKETSESAESAEPYDNTTGLNNVDSVWVLNEDETLQYIDMDTYITGVLLGELPADFKVETLKAQAIVARTYAKKRSLTGMKHPKSAVCVQSSCCQAYCSVDDYIQSGGKQTTVDKFKMAVEDTAGMVLTYQGDLADATYYSCSGGRTEDALAVWGTDVPYLQSVDSPGEENATHYTDRIEMSSKVFASKLGLELSGQPASWFGNVTYTSGGGVATIMIGGREFYGVDLREKLNLYSTAFSIMAVGENVHIFTRGFGHRVGMSQYGADAMATNGCDYQEILSHYYPGTTLSNYLD